MSIRNNTQSRRLYYQGYAIFRKTSEAVTDTSNAQLSLPP